MAINLNTSYPGKVTVDANNTNGTFKNRTSDELKDGTPYEKKWASDLWGFGAHILKLAGVTPNGAEENETNSQYYDALESLVGRRAVEFETSRDLVINFTSNTTAQATFSRMSLLDSNYTPKFLTDKTLTWTMPTDLEAGTSEKSDTTYGCWVDSDENVVLAPDIEGTCDSTISGFLVDSTATLSTDLIHDGDILYNLTTKVKTTASADASTQDRVAATDNIFSSGDQYKIVKMSPVGLGSNRERLGSVFNNSGSNFDDSHYTQIQEEKFYSEAGGDFSVTSDKTGSVVTAQLSVKQINDWTGSGAWVATLQPIVWHHTQATTVLNLSITGFSYTTYTQSASAIVTDGPVLVVRHFINSVAPISIQLASGSAAIIDLSGPVVMAKKPTFHN